jgi:hypothetical protein
MNPIRFISSYTVNTIYEKIIKDSLIPSLEKFNLPYHIFAVDSLGSWKINSRQRPLRIKEAMLMYPGENIVWIDADARVLQNPEVLFHIPDSCHIGINYMKWSEHYGNTVEKIELLDGTSYYKNSEEMLKFCDEWIERAVNQNRNHRRVLDQMINEKINENLNIVLIPREYCYIVTQPNGSEPAVPISNPVIAHFQASRQARENLNGS